ncbi:MAG: hypothetical protein RIQ81_2238 [Pseudomonadota bacterium]|jgi:hypothetical protein
MRIFLTAVSTLVLSTTVATAQSIRDEIQNEAQRIAAGVHGSGASATDLQQAFLKLREASALLRLGSEPPPQLFCEPRSSNYAYVTRLSDGHRFGTDVPTSLCRELISRATNGLVCGPRSSAYSHIYNLITGQALGSDVRNETCMEAVSRSTPQLVCAPRSSSYAYITRIKTGERLGSDMLFADCYEAIPPL